MSARQVLLHLVVETNLEDVLFHQVGILLTVAVIGKDLTMDNLLALISNQTKAETQINNEIIVSCIQHTPFYQLEIYIRKQNK